MAKERLSKLQKWILIKAYEKGKRQLGFFSSYTRCFLSRREVYEEYFNLRTNPAQRRRQEGWSQVGTEAAVALSRSAKSLKRKGLVDLSRYRSGYGISGKNHIALTYKGEEKAESLMFMTQVINNKKEAKK
ncbi:hypothetical protein ES707_06714 [subsurface metagenome]